MRTSSPRPRTYFPVVLVATLVASLLVAAAQPAAAASTVGRISGSDRVATAVAVADAGWDQAPHVLIATSVDYPDAIAAAALAASLDAPVLLNPPDTLSSHVRDALARLGTERVTVLGGSKAISATVVDQVQNLGLTVDRLAGDNRFETAAAIAESATVQAQTPVAALALGARADDRDAWPDALSAASLAGLEVPVPTLLTGTGELPAATRQALEQMGPERVVVLGGDAAVSDHVASQVASLGITVDRAEGVNRYRTAVEVARRAISGVHADSGQLAADQAVFASGETFPDALAAGALAARRGGPLLLVPSGRLADGVDAYLRHDDTPVTEGMLIGGPSAVSDFVQQELDAAIAGAPRPTPPPPPEPECPPNSSPDCTYTYRYSISTWEKLAQCESGGNWAINTGNGYYGGLQFSLSSWRAAGGSGYPHQASKWEQIHRGERLQSMQGWGAWPTCSRKIGLR